MMCHISKGDTPLEIKWLFNNEEMSRELGSHSKVGDRSSVLVLPALTDRHSGNYTCIARNRAGRASYTTMLKVIGTREYAIGARRCCLFLLSPPPSTLRFS